MLPTVLVVEARSEPRDAHSTVLREAGFDVIKARDAEAARATLESIVPSVLVAGLNSRTRIDHLALCHDVRRDPRTQQIPILLTTESVGEQDIELSTDPGALVLSAAPTEGAKLVAAVQGVLAVRSPERLELSEEQTISKRSA
jgi:DNA-binding response OmpR family regulator